MKVKMRTTSADAHEVKIAGQVYDVSEAEGKDLLAGGYASLVSDPKSDAAAAGKQPSQESSRDAEAPEAKTAQKATDPAPGHRRRS